MNIREALGGRTVRGVIWSFAERFSSQAIGFVVILVMTRLLTPADYGLVGMLTIFIQMGTSLCDSGFSQAIIRKRDRTESDLSTAFYFNQLAGWALYGLLWIAAPHIAAYYDEPSLTSLARVIGIVIPVSALMVVQRALLSSSLDFKTQTRASLVAYLLSGVAGIWMATTGMGVWAIAIYQVLTQSLLCVMLWLLGGWVPKTGFSKTSFRQMFGFSSRLAVADLIDVVYRNVYLLVIGKMYKASDVGYFTRAQQVGGFLSANVSYIVQRVSYPALCHRQDDPPALKESFMKMLVVTSACIFPVMWIITVMADDVIYLLLGEKWMYSAVLLPILCLGFMWHHVQSLNIQLLQVYGRSDLYLRVEIIKKAGGVGLLICAVPYGMVAICWSFVAATVLSLICNTWYNGSLYDMGLWRQLRKLGPIFLCAFATALLGRYAAGAINIAWLRLTVAVIVACLSYGLIILGGRRWYI